MRKILAYNFEIFKFCRVKTEPASEAPHLHLKAIYHGWPVRHHFKGQLTEECRIDPFILDAITGCQKVLYRAVRNVLVNKDPHDYCSESESMVVTCSSASLPA